MKEICKNCGYNPSHEEGKYEYYKCAGSSGMPCARHLDKKEESTMKVTLEETGITSEYPILKINSTKVIILFTSKDTGVVVSCGQESPRYVGENADDWDEDRFVKYIGKVILEN